jgi:uncharacterized protein (DUF1697 family)
MMNTCIAFLRGINVSGLNPIKMEVLRQQISGLGFRNVRTYIQSGNLLFEIEGHTNAQLEELISGKIKEDYGYKIPVIVMNFNELEQAICNNPYAFSPDYSNEYLHVTFLSQMPDIQDLAVLSTGQNMTDKFMVSGNLVYLYCPSGYGKTKFNNSFFEKKLKCNATTRNWKTVQKMIELASE